MALPLDQLLTPVSGDSPCGENEFDESSYGVTLSMDLSGLIADESGGAVEGNRMDASTGDWPSFLGKVIGYMSRTKHLGLAYYATLADTNLNGLAGLSDGVILINQLTHRYWENVHPLPDEGDSWERIDWLTKLNSKDLLDSVREIEIADAKQAGRFTLREALNGEDPGLVDAAINETLANQPDYYDQLSSQLTEVRQNTTALKEFVTENLPDEDFSLDPFEQELGVLARFLGNITASAPVDSDEAGEEVADGSQPSIRTSTVSGEIRTRKDVEEALTRIIRFYSKNEPASPVPQLLQRAKRMVGMDFAQIIEEFQLDRQTFSSDQLFGSVPED